MYQTEFFAIQELVPEQQYSLYQKHPEKLFMLFDVAALRTLDALRRRYGSIVVNNWHAGGAFHNSGWRPWECSEGAALSQHKFGRAFDCKFVQVTAEEVRRDLVAAPEREEFSLIHRIEAFDGMSWFHFDTGNHRREYGIAMFGAR